MDGQWQVLDLDDAVHVLPLNDLVGHEYTTDCVCVPDVDLHARPLVSHHSLDGRELYE